MQYFVVVNSPTLFLYIPTSEPDKKPYRVGVYL